MTRAVLSLGSNLGDRRAHLAAALAGLAPWTRAVSSVYRTAPWGGVDQDDFLNLVAVVDDHAADAWTWLARARAAEQDRDRDRGAGAVRWGPRTLDVDVLLVAGADGTPVTSDDPELLLPHPRLAERAFVLVPWAEIAPDDEVPGRGRVADLLAALPAADRAGVDLDPDLDPGAGGAGDGAGRSSTRGAGDGAGRSSTRGVGGALMTTRTSPSVLLVLAVAAGLATNLVLGLLYGSIPPLPAPAGLTFLLLGVVEAGFAVVLYRRIQRRPGARPVDALAAARAVALAKASALAGALVGGAWCGVLAHVLPRRAEVAAAASDTTAAVIGIVGAVVLVAAALALEWCCRTPDDPESGVPDDRR